MPATAHINGVFQPATDRFGDFTIGHVPHSVVSPEREARRAVSHNWLIGTGFVFGLVAFFGAISLIDRALFPEPALNAQEQAYFAQAYD
ncbi:hypothetical protein [Asticcacaulis sp. YBE204]|uniref:hypothetical protein n=1 Tax=Asticcacaulis sp. YBE204 TaxID=1282363 RepID=UPI0003C3DC54|nr:hypothetical protein [Asticcacaulis sp. YBE204]ESQ80173.1 hypothetical protein AEYBE204_06020 [Asticcacaulis sp. YBE204]